ncbi:MAG: tetratricopeptide repeat protein [Myxococcales bacterium]|nr:tetratricopeptide repeat protein [Myxococcales bacterium]
MNDDHARRARCAAHGLMYDSGVHSGCVVCRRERRQPEPQVTELPSKTAVAIVLTASVLLLVGSFGAIYAYFQHQWALVEADGPTEPEVGTVVAALPGIPEHKGQIMIGLPGTDAYGYPRDLPDKLTLQVLLRERRFEDLNAHLESLQAAFEEDFRKEKWPSVAFGAFHTADPELGGLIDEWVEATPESFAPYLARSEHRISLAWHYRGGKWAHQTSTKRFKKMQGTLGEVSADLDRALELRPRSQEARSNQLTLASAFGLGVKTKTDVLEDALRHCPYCFGPRAGYLGTIVPRWGGSHALMEKKAADWQYTDKNPKLRQLLGFADHDRCSLLLVKKKPRKAIPVCDRALEHGANAAFLADKGRALMQLERYDEAIELLSKALRILPQSASILGSRGSALLKAERYDEAAHDLVLATRLDPVNEHYEKNLHHILAKLVRLAYERDEAGKHDEAIAEYTRVLEMHPRYADAFSYRGYAYDKKGELRLAEQDYLRAIELDPNNVESYRGLDHVLFQQKRLDEIVQHWTRYLKRHPKDATALFERSGTYFRKGQIELAKRDVGAACRLGKKEACATEQRYFPGR